MESPACQRRQLQFSLRALLLLILVLGISCAWLIEFRQRNSFQRQIEEWSGPVRVWVWAPDPLEKYVLGAQVGVVGKVFVPREFNATAPPRVELVVLQAVDNEITPVAPAVYATVVRSSDWTYEFFHNFSPRKSGAPLPGTSGVPILPSGTYFIEARLIQGDKVIATGFTKLIYVD